MSAERDFDALFAEAIRRGLPGAVVLVGRRDGVLFEKTYGDRSIAPARIPMTADAVFDMASLTKVMATAVAVMHLCDVGTLAFADPVARHVPEFAAAGKGAVTIMQLLAHRSGLIADNALSDYADGPTKALERTMNERLRSPAGTKFVYSDVGYIVLGELVKRATGLALDDYVRRHIFTPLKMPDTVYRPDEALKKRCVPTERRDGKMLVGEVHDPRAARLGGVAGHAGLFSTAADTARFARMILAGGELDRVRVLSPAAVRRMVAPAGPVGEVRAIGWDVATPFSSPRGDLFAPGSVGHTGFTGTSLWIDPAADRFVVLLTSRLHPDGKGNVVRLRAQAANIAAAM